MGYLLEIVKNSDIVKWIVPDVEKVVEESSPRNSDIKKLHDIAVNIVANTIAKASGDLIGTDKLKWYTNYALFGAEILLLKSLISVVSPIAALPIVGAHWVGAIVGTIIQGNSGCRWQKELADASPIRAQIAGAVHGVICCAVMGMGMNLFADSLPSIAPLAKVAGLVATTGAMSHVMCFNERVLGYLHKGGINYALNEVKNLFVGEHKQESCCKKSDDKTPPVIESQSYKNVPSCCSRNINNNGEPLPENGFTQRVNKGISFTVSDSDSEISVSR